MLSASVKHTVMFRIAIIVIFAILAHTVLMTSTVDAAVHHGPAHGAGAMVEGASLADTAHGSLCFATQSAVTARSIPVQVETQIALFPTCELDVRPSAPPDSTPPQQPPNVVRALLQVYRI